MERRKVLKSMALVAAGLTASDISNAVTLSRGGKKKVLTIAHITDVHIAETAEAPARFKKCLDQIVNRHQPDFFLNGGDSIMDASYDNVTRERTTFLWNLWDECIASLHNKYEIYSCIGNHDPWWKAPSKEDEMYGIPYVVKRLKIPGRYYRVQKGSWHFIILDGNNKGIMLDEEQFNWLERELGQIPVDHHVALMSHYPVLSATIQFQGGGHSDFRRLKDLFYKQQHKVKLFLSGHNHLLDKTVYNQVTYCSGGAVSGYWWGKGDKDSAAPYYFKETAPGYTILKLYHHGEVESEYFAHGL